MVVLKFCCGSIFWSVFCIFFKKKEPKAELMLLCHVCYQRVEQETLEEWTVVYQLVYRSLLLDYNVVSSVGSLQCRNICKIQIDVELAGAPTATHLLQLLEKSACLPN